MKIVIDIDLKTVDVFISTKQQVERNSIIWWNHQIITETETNRKHNRLRKYETKRSQK